jgi:hypothetical protein
MVIPCPRRTSKEAKVSFNFLLFAHPDSSFPQTVFLLPKKWRKIMHLSSLRSGTTPGTTSILLPDIFRGKRISSLKQVEFDSPIVG